MRLSQTYLSVTVASRKAIDSEVVCFDCFFFFFKLDLSYALEGLVANVWFCTDFISIPVEN